MFKCLLLSSNYASVHHVPSVDSISSIVDDQHLHIQEVVGQVVLAHTHTEK